MKSISHELINILKEKTPEKESTAGFLMNMLPLGKEAVYRRLRGDIQFTLDEAYVICKKLNISLDLLMGIKQDNTYAFHLGYILAEGPLEEYCKMLYGIRDSMKHVKNDPTVYLYRAHKTLPQEFLYNYEFLSKVYIYILYYQLYSNSQSKTQRFSETSFPDDTFFAQKSSTSSVHEFNSTLILDKRIFIDYIEIVKYFEYMGMISQDEIEKIREEMHKLVNDMEKCAATGLSLKGKKMNIYISHISFDCSYTRLESENFNVSSIGIYCVDYLSSQNQRINEGQKAWIKSLLRFSTLISVSGELQRNEFFQDQRVFIDTML